jgi:hypothetical protein
MAQRKNPFDSATTRQTAVQWGVCIPSVVKVVTGGIVKGLAGQRIRNAWQRLQRAEQAERESLQLVTSNWNKAAKAAGARE